MNKHSPVIAVIDDDAHLRKAIDRLLSAHGYSSISFSSAEELLGAVGKYALTCLVLDIQLGATCGLALARRLHETGHRLPIVFITGASDALIERQAQEIGCTAFLRKPFRAADLIAALERAGAGHVCARASC